MHPELDERVRVKKAIQGKEGAHLSRLAIGGGCEVKRKKISETVPTYDVTTETLPICKERAIQCLDQPALCQCVKSVMYVMRQSL